MANNLTDAQIEEIILTVIDSKDLFSVYNDDRKTMVWVQNMDRNKVKNCESLLNDILLLLFSKPYAIFVGIKPDEDNLDEHWNYFSNNLYTKT